MFVGTGGIYADIYKSLASNQSLFPSLPETTIRLGAILNDPNCDILAAAKLLRTDPGLSAFIMRIANSAGYMSRVPPKDLESALRRIGLVSASRIATTFAIRSSFETSNQLLKQLLIMEYRKATKVAVISYLIAGKIRGYDASKAMLAGLLQDIALPPILLRLAERPEIFADSQKRSHAIDQLAPLVGVLILKNWKFDEDFIEVVRSRKAWLRDSGQLTDMSDIVLIARMHSLIGTPAFMDCPSFQDVPAFHKLPVGELTPENSIKMLDSMHEEIGGLTKMLAG